MRDPRIDKLAQVVINYSLGIKKGDIVLINAPLPAEPLVVAAYQAILRAGGHPHVRMSPDTLTEIMLKDASEEQLDFVSPLAKHDIETIDARLAIWAETNTRALSNTDSARHARLSTARKPIMNRFLERAAEKELRWTGTLFPTHASAQDAGMSLIEYEDFVFNACLLHLDDPVSAWQKIQQKQQQIVDFLNQKKTLRLEAANGTDLKMSIENRQWINCCGKENFPDGEVFTGPVEDSVQGTIAFSFPAVHLGHECDGVILRFEKGKVVEATAEKGLEFLQNMLAQDEGASRVGEFAIGTNYSVKQYTRNTLFDEKIGGTVHLAVGAAYPETGSRNQSGLHWDMVCDLRRGGRITVDHEVIFEDGLFNSFDLTM